MADTIASPVAAVRRPLYRELYFQVLVAITLGVALGYFDPPLAAAAGILASIVNQIEQNLLNDGWIR